MLTQQQQVYTCLCGRCCRFNLWVLHEGEITVSYDRLD